MAETASISKTRALRETCFRGNHIGTDRAGTADLGNALDGIRIWNDAGDNTIGGTAEGAGNVIAYSGIHGASLFDNAGTGIAIRRNSIFGNRDLGIALGEDGVTTNDALDADGGPNNLQNFPELKFANTDGASTTVLAAMHGERNTTFTIEYFANSTADPSGYGEGAMFLGSDTVTTADDGDVVFVSILPVPAAVGAFVTATATAPDNSTSEFSEAVPLEVGLRISGTVYEDIDGDGEVSGAQGRPGVDVTICLDDGNGVPDSADTRLATLQTDAGGGYEFPSLAAARYWISVDSRTLAPEGGLNAGFDQADVWAEQTYGTAGALCDDGTGSESHSPDSRPVSRRATTRDLGHSRRARKGRTRQRGFAGRGHLRGRFRFQFLGRGQYSRRR